jgi:hypothetical protein
MLGEGVRSSAALVCKMKASRRSKRMKRKEKKRKGKEIKK